MSVASATASSASLPQPFTPGQKEYLAGFMAGVAASGVFVGTTSTGQLTASASASTTPNLAAPVAASASEPTFHGPPLGDLCKEERWKYEENPLDAWERLLAHADADQAPDPENLYRFKFHGLFYVAPAQDSFMLRIRVPACEITAAQCHGLAQLSTNLGNGFVDLTTRGNFQIREFKPRSIVQVLTRIQELGLASRGAGCDNVRNVTASPNSGFDPAELIDVRPFAKGIHHYILNHRDLYGLPRKFNIAFDNGGSLSAAVDTNDIGFFATRVTAASLSNLKSPLSASELSALSSPRSTPPAAGVYFRIHLGGITGHGDFARDTGLLIQPAEAVAVSAAMLRVFAENGDRTNRKKARLKYLLEKWGVDKFLAETQKKLAFPLVRLPPTACEPRRPVIKHGWLGPARQSQRGLNSLGIGVPVGRLSSKQLHTLADLATHFGTGELRLTVWQSVIIPHVADAFVETVKRSVVRLGCFYEASLAAGGIIACTGRRGCKFAAADTKAHGLSLLQHLGQHTTLTSPVNIHFTGCPNSCAQHYCGDLGFVGHQLPDGADGYHLVLGGGMDQEQGIARELFRGLRATEINALSEKILITYEAQKKRGESFVTWARRHSVKELQEILSQ